MGITVDNTTTLSKGDKNVKRYAANFEFFPFHEGETYSLYKGVLNGESFTFNRHGQRCIVRTFRHKTSSDETDWKDYVERVNKAREMTAQFHKEMDGNILTFPLPLLAKVNQKSSFVGLFRRWNPHEKHLKPNEPVLMEPLLEGPFQKFDQSNSSNEPQSQTSANVSAPNSTKFKHSRSRKNSNFEDYLEMQSYPHELLTDLCAFSHFTWHASKKFVITDLQGVYDEETSLFTLVNPTIHSVDQSFGQTDRGLAGIEDFFERHACQKNCATWFRYEVPDPNGNAPESISSLYQPD